MPMSVKNNSILYQKKFENSNSNAVAYSKLVKFDSMIEEVNSYIVKYRKNCEDHYVSMMKAMSRGVFGLSTFTFGTTSDNAKTYLPNCMKNYEQNPYTGKTVIQTSGNNDEKSVIYSIYGKDIAEAVIETDYEYEGIHVYGVVGKPEIARSNRSNQLYFVNGRQN